MLSNEKLLIGNTYRIELRIYDYDQNTLIDPDLLTVKIYNSKYELQDTIPNLAVNKIETGHYYAYFAPTQPGVFVWEWYAEKTGTPSLSREKFVADFV